MKNNFHFVLCQQSISWPWWGGGTQGRGPKDNTAPCRSLPAAAAGRHPSQASSGLASLRKPLLNEPTCPDHSTPGQVCRQQFFLARLWLIDGTQAGAGWLQVHVPTLLLAPLEMPLLSTDVPPHGGEKWLWNHTAATSSGASPLISCVMKGRCPMR